ncbi:MAG: methyl-accepting chemotaxis protein, partial [Clostridia bacterium]|nr:methyl-accepting chemotaxis protein [Clostridia bacterium]
MRQFIKNIKIRAKLLAAFTFVALMMLFVVLVAYTDMTDSASKIRELHTMIIIPLDHLSRTTIQIGNIKIEGRTALLDRNPTSRNQTIQQASNSLGEIKELITQYESTILVEEARAPYGALLERLDEYTILWDGFGSLLRTERTDEAQAYLEERLSPVSDACLEYLAELTAFKLGRGEELASDARGTTQELLFWLVLISAVGLLITIAFGIYFSVTISGPIMKGAALMIRAADGDFTVRLPADSGAEIGQLFAACNLLNTYIDTSITNLKEAIIKMRGSAQNMLAISSLMASNSKGLNEQTSFVSSTTEEFSAGMTQSSSSLSTASTHISAVASSIEEINSTISTVAAAAEQTSTRVEQSSTLVDNIQNSIAKASGSVTLVSNAFNSVAGSVNDINKSILVVSEHSVA